MVTSISWIFYSSSERTRSIEMVVIEVMHEIHFNKLSWQSLNRDPMPSTQVMNLRVRANLEKRMRIILLVIPFH